MKWVVSVPLKGTNLMKNFVCLTEVELRELLEQYPDASVEMKDSHLEDHAPLPLTDDQQVVLEWLKKKIDSYLDVSYLIGDLNYFAATPVGQAWKRLSKAEQFQVLAAFAEWGMENE